MLPGFLDPREQHDLPVIACHRPPTYLIRKGAQTMVSSATPSRTSRSVASGRRFVLGLCLGLLAAVPAVAAAPTDAETRAAQLGQPTALVVLPKTIDLTGPQSTQQIIVTGQYA